MRNAPLLAIEQLARHASLRTTLRYMHLSPAEKDRAIRLLDKGRRAASAWAHTGDAAEGVSKVPLLEEVTGVPEGIRGSQWLVRTERQAPLHADVLVVAEPGGALVFEDRARCHCPRRVHLGDRSPTEADAIHQAVQQDRQAGPVGLRRSDEAHRMIAVQVVRTVQLSNCHRHALREWLLALKRANLGRLPHRRYSCVMRPLRYSINVTLDGCCDHRAISADEDLNRHAAENLDQADALLFGRVTYEMMEAAFRPPARTGARPDWMEPFARTIDAAKKYVVSSTLDRVDWNAELVRGDLGKAVQQLKRESSKGLLVGGVKLPLALAELGLIDEYEFVVHPRLAGHGPTLFAGLSKHVDLRLVSRLEFGSGAVAMRYEPRRAVPPNSA